MNNPDSNNILGFDNFSSSNENIISQPMILPYPLNVLIICDNESIEQGLKSYCSQISNLQIEYSLSLLDTLNNFNLIILVIDNDELSKSIIEKIAAHDIDFLILADDIKSELVRVAIHYKVKDIISIADVEKELHLSLLNVSNELIKTSKVAPVFTVINGKAGAGASFVTSCLGEISANLTTEDIGIVDADLNYGTLADTFNFEPNYFITDALDDLDQLDTTAIRSMMLRHDNLGLLASKPYTLLNENTNTLIH